MGLRLKTLMVVLTAAALLIAGACVPSMPTQLPTTTPTPTPETTSTPGVPLPCLNGPATYKVDPILGQLLGRKNQSPDLWYDPWREVLERPQIVVGVRTDHPLTEDELDAVLNNTGVRLGKTYEWSDGTVSYGATVTWDKICPLLNLPVVVGMSTSNPYPPRMQ